MLRTILLRNKILNQNLKKALRTNFAKCVSTELSRKNLSRRILTPTENEPVTPLWSVKPRFFASLPSHKKVMLPALSPTMESGNIVSWAKKEGDQLSEGDLLCEIETDKATMGFETPEEGYLAKILIPTGTKGVPVGKLLCIIVENKEDVAAFKDFKDAGGAAAPAPKKAAEPAPAPAAAPAAAAPAPAPAAAAPRPAPAAAAPSGDRVMASPMAKRIAELKSLRLGGTGSGLYGSIKSSDLAGMAAGGAPSPAAGGGAAPAPAPAPGASFVDIPLSGMRSTIAKRLTESKQTIPHYQLSVTVNVEKTLAMRKRINDKLKAEKSDIKVSVNDFIVKAVASACKRVPAVNAHWMGSSIRQFANVDVSVAVATPTGLITPILFNADSRGMLELSQQIKALAAKAKEGSLAPEEYQGGTVTISNLGMFGITAFNAIVNPPQALILACGGPENVVVEDSEDPRGFRTAKFITFTASADHRIIDGAVGAQWMKALKANLEDPANMIL